MAGYFFASPIDVDIRLEGEEQRKQFEYKTEEVRRCDHLYAERIPEAQHLQCHQETAQVRGLLVRAFSGNYCEQGI